MKNNLKESLEAAFENYKRLVLKEGPINQLDHYTATDVMGYGTTIDEIIHDLTGMKELARLQRQQTEGPNFNYKSTPIFRKIMEHGKSAICVDEIQLNFLFDEQPLSFGIRLSVIMEMINGQWKAVHFHASKPEYDSGGNDPWHREEWNQKMQELQQKVDEQTAELLNQNRELEIEATLERVRTVAMSMQKPDDLLEVCRIISDQLETLNVKNIRNVQVAIINESNRTYANYQYFAAYAKTAYEETGYENNPASQSLVTEMQKSANSFFIGSIKGKDLEEFRNWRKKYNQLPDPLLEDHAVIFHYFYSIGQGGLGLTTYEEISNESLEIFKRFHKVFTLAYQRYKDIRQALEQAREARIEAALERVRSLALGMRKSEEVGNVTDKLFEELNRLTGKIFGCTIAVVDKEKDHLELWRARTKVAVKPFETVSFMELMRIFKKNMPDWFPVFYKALIAKEKNLLTEDISGKRRTQMINSIAEQYNYSKEEKSTLVKNTPQKFTTHFIFFKLGYLALMTEEKYTDENLNVVKRFVDLFGFAYTRFLDLKNAEAQTREAQIEAALERVRSRSMAMQNSEELADLSFELVRQVHALGINTWFCAFNIYDDDPRGSLEWGSNMQGTYEAYRTPREGIFLRYYRAGQSGETLLINEIGKDECSDHYDYLCSLPGVGEQLLKMKDAGIPFPVSQIDHVAYFKYGYIIFITFEPVPAAHDIFKRFAKVFEQTYTRFLDLTAAEAQARESALELSLERIRSQVTAMQESSELFDIVVNMRNEFVGLGHEADYFWHMRWLPDVYKMWMTSDDGSRIGTVISIPKYVHDNIPGLAEWEKGDGPVYVLPLDANGAWDYIENMNTHGHYEKVDPNAPTREDIEHIGGLTFIMARTTHGEIGFGLPGYVADPPQESLDTLVRFAGVFDLAYRRFEDLKSAERQNRETQIELSLERIRAKTMAMQNSEELGQTVLLLFDELKHLGLDDLDLCGIGVVQENYRMEAWTASKMKSSESGLVIGNIDLKQHQMLQQVYINWKAKKESFHYLLEGQEKVNYFNNINNQQGYKAGRDIATLPEKLIANAFYFNEGCLYAFTSAEIPSEKTEIFKRFAAVFGQTYRRYLDLQIAEARTLEAIKQSSLDRIRGQIASMRNATDLQQITPLIWNELTALEVPFFRCGVFIVDEKQHHVKVYLTTPEGKSLASLDLDFDMSDLTRSTVDSWRKKEVYQTHWSKKDFISWTDEMMKIRQVKNPEKYQGAETPPESLHLHFIPFPQGMLYVGNNDQLSDEHIDLVKSLADAFSFAYARYQDFVVLEEAKQSVEKALNELKAAQSQLVHAEKMASLGELTAGIAHEIQNPLNFVNNFAEVSTDIIDDLNEEIDNNDMEEVKAIAEDLKQNLQKIGHHGQRASSIVKGMLEHSRSGSGKKEPTDINALTDEYLRLAYHGLRAKDKSFNADFKTDFDDSLPKIEVMPQDIGRVLLNLINNAFYAVHAADAAHAVQTGHALSLRHTQTKPSPEKFKPTVTLTTRNLGDKIEIRVQDNGNGIPEEIKDKIFQPFFTTKPTGQGTGLGLSMSYDIITKGHNGNLRVESMHAGKIGKTGAGAEFIVTLPLKPEIRTL